jgi:hypothetical protein
VKRIRRTASVLSLPALNLEGGLFLPDQMEKAALGAARHQTEADYALPKGLKLKDEYSRAFQIACAQWKHFAVQMERGDLDAAAITRNFVHELLRDAFGYTQMQSVSGITVAERRYPVALLAGQVPIVVGPHSLGLDEADPRFAVMVNGVSGEWRVANGKKENHSPLATRHSPRKKSAFQALQELLNASAEHRWGIVCNGRQLRLLRDAATLTRPSFLEVDLQDLLGGQRFAEFANVWRLLHVSRSPQAVNGEWRIANEKKEDHSPLATRHSPPSCIWEAWRTAGQEEGARVRAGLRLGVTQALLALGEGFLQHPGNEALRAALHTGELSQDAYFQQLLRLVYRLIFVFSVEERGLLHGNDDSPEALAARRAYAEGYALARLRDLCLKRRARNRFDDHWQAVRIVFRGLAQGEPRLALPALGGLFAVSQCPHLDAAALDNAHLLAALQHLRWASHNGTLAPVDYRNMGPEELGSVYESLLELVPDIDLPARSFGFVGLTREGSTAGNARKLTGSYYTPDSLVQELIKSALDPVIEQRLAEAGRIANGEWSTVPTQYREVFIHYANSKLSRTGGMATSAQLGQGRLSTDRHLSGERTLWPDRPNETGSGVDTQQYRRGMGQTLPGGVHSISQNSQRQPGRIGNATDPFPRPGLDGRSQSYSSPERNHDTRQTTTNPRAQPQLAEAELVRRWQDTSTTIRHSLFTTHALLYIRVIDPACGSGHFLLAAARRLAEKLAQLQSPEGVVKPQDYRHALREVVARCIFGVDRNPMALELARTALWLEGYEEGRPLSFLDHHLQCGDALLGLTDLKALEKGIAKDAYKPLSGDDKAVCKRLAKINAAGLKQLERDLKGPQTRLRFDDADSLAALQSLEALPENSTEDIAAKETAYRDFLEQAKESRLAHAADLLLGAYLLPKTADNEAQIPTSATLYLALLTDTLDAGHRRQLAAAQATCREARVLHWPLAFPQVFAAGGFDCVLGNPPWERIKLQEEEFFATRHRDVAEAKNKAERAQRIQWLSEGMLARHLYPQVDHPPHECEAEQRLHAEFIGTRRTAEAASLFAHVKGEDGGRYPLTGVGDVNTYALFAETISQITRSEGRAGFIVPTGIATDDSTKAFFADITQSGRLVSLLDIENRERLFPDVDSRMKFCLLTLGQAAHAEFVCFASQVGQLGDPRRRFRLTPEEFRLINPNTLTCPVFRTRMDAELTKKIYVNVPVLIKE